MKKIIFALGIILVLFTSCSSTDSNFKKINIKESEPQYILEDIS